MKQQTMKLFKHSKFSILAGIINPLIIKKKRKQKTGNRKLFLVFLTLNLMYGFKIVNPCFAQAPCKTVVTGTTALCKSDSAILTTFTLVADTSYKYKWSTGDTTTTITAKPNSTTTYWVTVSNKLCTDTAAAIVQITKVKAVISGDSILCKGKSAILTASGGTKYVWNTSNPIDTTATLTVEPLVDTQYSVTVSNCTCPGTAQKSIKVNPLPLLRAEKDTTITSGGSVLLSAIGTGILNYLWTPSTGLSSATIFNPTANPQTTMTYIVTGTDSNGCTSRDSVVITLLKENCEPYVPNAFSPNADGQNDFLKAHSDCIKELLSFSIYDRWGEKVFETEDINIGWDGTYKGKPMNAAVFVYYLTATSSDGKPVTQKGNISLIR